MFQAPSFSALNFPVKTNMPIDLVLPLYLSTDEMGYRKTPKPCINPTLTFARSNKGFDRIDPSNALHENDDNDSNNNNDKKVKKKVSFADHKGLSLTRVKTFSESRDPIEIPLKVQALFSSAQPASSSSSSSAVVGGDDHHHQLVLDFKQPSADYLRFRRQLEQHGVCLEHCVLRERTLAGTVCVKNLSFEKAVSVRITFDAWKSHDDVKCAYVMSTYLDTGHDTFSFEVTLPNALGPDEHIEFAISYEVRGVVHWDSNQGENYKVVWSSRSTHHHQGRRRSSVLGIQFEPYGSPTCSRGLFPDWPSYAMYENIGPYY